jgi:hypothetical protein
MRLVQRSGSRERARLIYEFDPIIFRSTASLIASEIIHFYPWINFPIVRQAYRHIQQQKLQWIPTMKLIPAFYALPLTLLACSPLVHAEPLGERGEGGLARGLFGDTLNDYGIQTSMLLDIGFSRNNRSTHDERDDGLSNSPLAGEGDEGFQLRSLHLFIEKPINSNVIPRITPLPGPTPDAFAFGFNFEMLYGRNAQFARTPGWDEHWGINSPGDDDSDSAKRHRQNFLAVPNIFATAYLPYGPGITLWSGIFGPALGYEIPPNVRDSRNTFATKSYAFLTEPGTVAGVMAGTRLYAGELGIVGAELGVVQGWNNLRDNNDSSSLNGALRWRSADMKTWIDYEFMAGEEQNDSFSDVQAPTNRLVSPRGQLKQEHSLNGWHAFNEQWSMGAELVYGRQDGDGRAETIDIINGPGFSGATWWGANALVTYQYRKDLAFSARAEHFNDKDGFILFPSSAARGSINAITLGSRYDLSGNISLRPELRYDWQSGTDDKAFGNGRNQSQFTALVEALVYF